MVKLLDKETIHKEILEKIYEALDDKTIDLSSEMKLIGGGLAFDSLRLVSLCVELEDYAEYIGFEFNWTSEMAMSKSKSMFRSVGSLVDEFCAQWEQAQ